MSHIKISLNQLFRSFPTGFKTDISGELIILSGINGSGKSQLLQIISGKSINVAGQKIEPKRVVNVDGINISPNNTLYKSLKETFNVGEFAHFGPQNATSSAKQFVAHYRNNRLNLSDPALRGYQVCCQLARKAITDKYGQDDFNSGTLTDEEIKDAIIDIEWRNDDIFTNQVSAIFYEYAKKEDARMRECARSSDVFVPNTTDSPWIQLNSLFRKLGFSYRFHENYEIAANDFSLSPELRVYEYDGKTVDYNQARYLSDLSDGEKAIIALAFSTTYGADKESIRMLLLDEFDATFNPSLTKAFFTIVEDYYLDKGIIVLVATHSPVTISLAPANANFYEVFKRWDYEARILPVPRDDYTELAVANKRFYDEINQQSNRIIELESYIKRLEVKDNNKLQIISEGDNHLHIEKAIKILKPDLLSKVEFPKFDNSKTSREQLKVLYERMSKLPNSYISLYVWDADAESIVQPIVETDTMYKHCLGVNPRNTKYLKEGIEKLYPDEMFDDTVMSVSQKPTDVAGQFTEVRSLDKKKFLTKILSESRAEIFHAFSDLITRIESLVK